MITAQEVASWLNIGEVDEYLALVIPAVNLYVENLPNIDRDESGVTWADTTRLGAIMLGARMYQRKNSPGGIEAAGEAGVTYVSRWDSDISRLLNIDSFKKPVIG